MNTHWTRVADTAYSATANGRALYVWLSPPFWLATVDGNVVAREATPRDAKNAASRAAGGRMDGRYNQGARA